MTTLMLALACAALWVGRPRTQYRLGVVSGEASRVIRRAPRTCAAVGGVALALMCGGVAAAIAALLVVAMAGWRIRRSARAAQSDRARDDLLTALSLMIAELSVGSPPARACAVAAQQVAARAVGVGSSEVGAALGAMAGRAELGGSVVLDSEVEVAGDESWRRIALAWSTSDVLGLPLADLLESVRADLLARKAFAERTRAGLAGARATASVLAGLPLLGIALGQGTGARPVQTLLGGGIGGVLLVLGTGLGVLGAVWSERITDKALAG